MDGAYSPDSGRAGIGVVIRNEEGQVDLCSWGVLFDAVSVEETEARACLEGFHLAAEWVRKKAILETDCASLMSAVNATNPCRSLLIFMLQDIRVASRLLPDCKVRVVKRERNQIVHELAQLAKHHGVVGAGSRCVEELVAHECNASAE